MARQSDSLLYKAYLRDEKDPKKRLRDSDGNYVYDEAVVQQLREMSYEDFLKELNTYSTQIQGLSLDLLVEKISALSDLEGVRPFFAERKIWIPAGKLRTEDVIDALKKEFEDASVQNVLLASNVAIQSLAEHLDRTVGKNSERFAKTVLYPPTIRRRWYEKKSKDRHADLEARRAMRYGSTLQSFVESHQDIADDVSYVANYKSGQTLLRDKLVLQLIMEHPEVIKLMKSEQVRDVMRKDKDVVRSMMATPRVIEFMQNDEFVEALENHGVALILQNDKIKECLNKQEAGEYIITPEIFIEKIIDPNSAALETIGNKTIVVHKLKTGIKQWLPTIGGVAAIEAAVIAALATSSAYYQIAIDYEAIASATGVSIETLMSMEANDLFDLLVNSINARQTQVDVLQNTIKLIAARLNVQPNEADILEAISALKESDATLKYINNMLKDVEGKDAVEKVTNLLNQLSKSNLTIEELNEYIASLKGNNKVDNTTGGLTNVGAGTNTTAQELGDGRVAFVTSNAAGNVTDLIVWNADGTVDQTEKNVYHEDGRTLKEQTMTEYEYVNGAIKTVSTTVNEVDDKGQVIGYTTEIKDANGYLLTNVIGEYELDADGYLVVNEKGQWILHKTVQNYDGSQSTNIENVGGQDQSGSEGEGGNPGGNGDNGVAGEQPGGGKDNNGGWNIIFK